MPALALRRNINKKRVPSAITFALPIITENIVTTVITMVLATYIGKLSSTALTAMGTTNTIINFINTLSYMMTTAAAVVVSRALGAEEKHEASVAAEQGVASTALFFTVIGSLFALLAPAVISLLTPTAEPQLFEETVLYLRLLSISLPFFYVYQVCCLLLRAAGTTVHPMLLTILLNGIQIVLSALVVTKTDYGLMGLGVVYIICRVVVAVPAFIVLLKRHTLSFSFVRMLKPNFEMLKRIFRLGIPDTLSGIFVQGGYILANTMIVGLGTFEATTYQVVYQVQLICYIPVSVCSTLVIPLAGRALGENNVPKAKKAIMASLWAGLAASIVLSLIAMLMGGGLTAFFSKDSAIIQKSGNLLWLVLVYTIFALAINVFEPALKTGGDTKFLMVLSGVAIWIVRLPLTYLFCYFFTWGTPGIYYANFISLFLRTILLFIRYLSGKWLAHKV